MVWTDGMPDDTMLTNVLITIGTLFFIIAGLGFATVLGAIWLKLLDMVGDKITQMNTYPNNVHTK